MIFVIREASEMELDTMVPTAHTTEPTTEPTMEPITGLTTLANRLDQQASGHQLVVDRDLAMFAVFCNKLV